MFLTSRYPDGLYSILVNTCKIDAEKKLNKRLTLNKINLKKIPPIRYIFYFFLFLISAKIFDKNKCLKYKYKGIPIGRHVLAECVHFRGRREAEGGLVHVKRTEVGEQAKLRGEDAREGVGPHVQPREAREQAKLRGEDTRE